MADPQAIIARGHAALDIGQSLLPSNDSRSKSASAKLSGIREELNASKSSLKLSQDEYLKTTWKWNDMDDEADIAKLVKESGLRILDVIEAVWQWQSLQDDGDSNLDHKEFLLTLTERKHLRILISLIPTRVTLPQVKEYLLSPADIMEKLESTEIISFANLTTRLLRLITLPPSSTKTDLHSFLSAPTVLPFILLPPLLLGWTQAFPPPTFSDIRKSFLEYLDEQLGPGDAMSTLGGISTIMTPRRKPQTSAKIVPVEEEEAIYPEYAKRTVRALMGRQLIRKGGVAGLLGNVFGAGERNDGKISNDVLELHKLDYVTKLLAVPVHGMTPKEFNDNVFEQLRTIIVPADPTSAQNTPQHHVRAAAYVLGQHSVTIPACRQKLQHSLHTPLYPQYNDLPQSVSPSSQPIITTRPNDVNSLLSLLLPLLTLNPPPPPFLDLIITPIVSPLFLLWQYLEQDKTADPLTKKELQEVIAAWIRLMDVTVVEKGLWHVLNGGRGWKVAGMGGLAGETSDILFWDKAVATGEEEDAGVAVFFGRPPSSPDEDLKLAADPNNFNLSTKLSDTNTKGQETQANDNEEDFDILPDLASLKLWPDPELLVSALEKSGRPDLSSRFFVRCLQAYQDRSMDEQSNPETTLLLLQVIMRLSDKVSANLGREVRHVLLFIEHALRAPGESSDATDEADSDDGSDSDDEDIDDAEEATVAGLTKDDVPNLGLVETALNLLVATLHGDANITSDSQPIIKPIEQHVERLNKHRLANIRQAAKAASLLLAVRKATPATGSASTGSDTAQRYQEALKLLQDPILAVRAHGLMILQSIVRAPDFDHALIPAIMDIFLSAIRDDDSFMYLNAIKGLSSLVDGIGAEVMNSISQAYVEDLDRNINIKADELDRRLRLGEALQQSIRRAGTALSGYIRPIVPRLLRVFPNRNLATVIRSSSLSILATCADTEWRALLPWSNDLIASCLDLLRLESVSHQPTSESNPSDKLNEDNEERDDEQTPTTNEPTRINDSKHPALRRAALVFLGLIFDAVAKAAAEALEAQTARHPEIRMTTTRHTVSATPSAAVDPSLITSAKTVLNYIKHTDVDSLAAHQAGEVVQILRQLPM